MKPITTVVPLFILVLITGNKSINAQNQPLEDAPKTEATPEVLVLESKTLLADIDTLSKKATALKAHVKNNLEVDRILFISLISNIEGNLRSKLDRLIEIKTILDKDKRYIGLPLKAIQTIILEQSIVLQQEIKMLEGIVTKMRNKETKDDSLIFAIDRAEQKMDALIKAWQKNIRRGNTLKLDMDEDNDQLNQLIQFRSIGLAGRIQIMLDATKFLDNRLANASEEQRKLITQQLYELELRKTATASNLENMVGLMNEQGLETTEFGKVLVVATGEILNENVNTEAVVGSFESFANKTMTWLDDNLPVITFRVIVFILTLLVFKILAGIVSRFVDRLTMTSDSHSSQLLKNFCRSIASKTVMLIGLVIALSQLGIEIGPLLAGMGVMGFVVGFALQDTLSNFASGMMILVYRPYDIGDFVDVANISGQVKEMNLVSTTILTIDHQRMVIPNNKIWGDIITNVTAERLRRIDMVFAIGYTDSITKAEAVLHEIISHHQLILDDPVPLIKVHKLSVSSVDFIVRPWVNSKDYWDVYWDITRQVKEEFDRAGISIPFPQQDIHVYPAVKNT